MTMFLSLSDVFIKLIFSSTICKTSWLHQCSVQLIVCLHIHISKFQSHPLSSTSTFLRNTIAYSSSSLKSSSHASCVCRRHSDLRSLSVVWRWPSYTAGVCLHSRGFAVDEGKPAAAESSQDRVSWCASYVNTMISTDPSCRWCFGIASHYRPVSWCPVHINADITMTLLMRSNFILTSRRTTIQFCTSIASDRQKRTAKARWGSGVYLQHPAFCQANQEQSRPQDVRVATGRRPSRQHHCQSRKHLPTTRAV